MNELDRLLALDAALLACESCGNPKFRKLVSLLQKELDVILEKVVGRKDFGTYLKAQKQAVTRLAQNPEVFGA